MQPQARNNPGVQQVASQTMVYPGGGGLLSRKKEGTAALCTSLGESQKTTGGEGEALHKSVGLYDSVYVNLWGRWQNAWWGG